MKTISMWIYCVCVLLMILVHYYGVLAHINELENRISDQQIVTQELVRNINKNLNHIGVLGK
jgi:cell division protein FtsL